MKIISRLNNINDANRLIDCDYIIIPTSFSMFYIEPYEDNIDYLVSLYGEDKIIIDVSMIIHESKINDLFSFLDRFSKYNFSYLFSDMAIFTFFSNENKLNKLFYFASTYITNVIDVRFFKKYGIKVFLSHEIAYGDVCKSLDDNTILQVYGYYPIYYSYRKVMSLYFDKYNIDKHMKEGLIKEELRESLYPIIESANGTVIMSDKKMMLHSKLNDLNVSYIYIESIYSDIFYSI